MGYFYTLNPITFHHDSVSTEIPFELRYEISDKEHTLLIAATMVGKEYILKFYTFKDLLFYKSGANLNLSVTVSAQ